MMPSNELFEVRAELRRALKAAEAEEAGAAEAGLLLDAGRRAVAVIEDVAEDEKLWARLRGDGLERPRSGDWGALLATVEDGLPELLVGLGYEGPPPAEELVDTAIASLVGFRGRGRRRRPRRSRGARRSRGPI